MKFLVAIALLALAVAEATHVAEHTLRGSRFKIGGTTSYEAVLNMTAGVLGLSSQVSAAILRADVQIYAKTEAEHILKIDNARVSGSLAAIDNKNGDIELEINNDLKNRLAAPIKFTLDKGMITSYTLSDSDNLESRKIKRSILRSLEMHVPERIVKEMEKPDRANEPIMYNTAKDTEYGVHISNYIITSSPDVGFPSTSVVYNITQIDNCEGEWYPGYKIHHNFQKQGCPEVCRQSGGWKDNQYGAGCPIGFEPHRSPIKKSFSHHHSLSPVRDTNGLSTLSPEIITTTEVHFANMYDQDMEVLVRLHMKREEFDSEKTLDAASKQELYHDLHEMDKEINENEIDLFCKNHKTSADRVQSAEELLAKVAELIVEGKPSSPIGEKIILLKEVLSTFTLRNFNDMAGKIEQVDRLEHEDDTISVQRQVWLEMLPLIGTPESVKFIVKYIPDELSNEKMVIWEAKEMLESLPQNIRRPDEETITEIQELLEKSDLLQSTLLHSAVHMCMGRIIGEICGNVPLLRQEQSQKQSWMKNFQRASPENKGLPKCPEEKVRDVIKIISDKLKVTRRPEEMVIYIEALAHTGMKKALEEINDYAHGTASNMQHFSPRLMAFTRSSVLHALHNMVGRHPEQVMEIALPIYFNDTESPKVRTAAFGVLIRCQPSVAILERIVTFSWFERSREVGSFVTTTLETFGNSSLPCMQLLSHRINEILPQMKRFNFGLHHAKNNMWTYFDDLRQFGLEGRLEYTPNNESYIPSTFYNSLSYTMDSLKDTVFQSSLNIEGLTQERILKFFIRYMKAKNIKPLSGEDVIFGKGKEGMYFMKPRTVEDLRFVTFQKLFYKTSFYYLDDKQFKSAKAEFIKALEMYLLKKEGDYKGYLVKVFLPSSYHTIAMAKTLPYPVEFQMSQPIVLSLGVETDKSMSTSPTIKDFDFHLKPSIYLSKIFTHQMKNLRDCKEVGVYHTHKIGITYPFQIQYKSTLLPQVEFKYKVPVRDDMNVLYYYTESGTYAGKKGLKTLPLDGERKPIRVLPTPFKFSKNVSLVGLPPFRAEIFTEDMNLFHQKLPRTPTEALHLAVRNILNSGWRYKSANITLYEDSSLWTKDSKATFKIEYSRKHIPKPMSLRLQDSKDKHNSEWNRNSGRFIWQHQTDDYRNSQNSRQSEDVTDSPLWGGNARQSEDDDYSTESSKQSDPDWKPWDREGSRQSDDDEDWSTYLEPSRTESAPYFFLNSKAILNLMSKRALMGHTLKISLSAVPLASNAYVLMEYNHTYEKYRHSLHVQAVLERPKSDKAYEVHLRHLMGYGRMPDEFHYDNKFGEQLTAFRTTIDWPQQNETLCEWENMEKCSISASGFFSYNSIENVLQSELFETVKNDYFLPETHKECLRDVRNKNPLSIDCIKAIRERSAFNKLQMNIKWSQDLPERVKKVAKLADVYMKHYFFENLQLSTEENKPKNIDIEMQYIDKFVDEPLADWIIEKPSETVTLRRIPIQNAQPFSSIYTMQEAMLLKMTNNTYPVRCVLSDRHVQTYDLVTYPFERKNCQYVLSAHCTINKHFAIIVHGSQEIHIHLASTKIVLSPREEYDTEGYEVKYNKDSFRVTESHPVVFDEKNDVYAYVAKYNSQERKTHDHITVIARRVGIKVIYDGKTVKIEVSPRYKGELCGLCSEFDGEELREFRGLDRCLYTDPADFAESNMVHRGRNCKISTNLRGGKLCENSKDMSFKHSPTQERNEPSLQRNVVIYKEDEACFSVRPLPSCQDEEEPLETETERIGFHCLPKDDLTARKMITEAKWRPLDELRRKSVDHAEMVDVPKSCSTRT